MVMNNSYTLGILNGDFSKANLEYVEPEYVQTRELGYRYNGKKVSLDVSAYWSKFTNFITEETVITPLYGSVNNLSGAAAVGVVILELSIGIRIQMMLLKQWVFQLEWMLKLVNLI